MIFVRPTPSSKELCQAQNDQTLFWCPCKHLLCQSPKRQLLFGCRGQQHHHQVANVSILEVVALWGDYMAFPADQVFQYPICAILHLKTFCYKNDQKCHNICFFIVKIRLYKIGPFVTPQKSHARNGRSDSTHKILTLFNTHSIQLDNRPKYSPLASVVV